MGWSKHHPVGLIHNSPTLSYRGYTLYTTNGGTHATLVDMDGQICHRWEHDEGIAYAQLLPDGHLLFRSSPPTEEDSGRGLGGASAALIELDWDGNKVWEYRNPWLHHDYQRQLNGNTLVLLWEELSTEVSDSVRGGIVKEEEPEVMLGDIIREIDSDGNTLNEWSLWQGLDVEVDEICPLHDRREWTHMNSLNLTNDNNFLISSRTTNTVSIVSRETGEYTWRWGPGEVWHQHNPTQLANGNILMFDNGSHSRGFMERSRLVEVNPETNEIEWQYVGSPPMSFYSFHISSADRLPNGNTLTCEGAHGRIFEVTPSGDIVWEYINPFFAPDRSGALANATFRAHRYGPDFTGFVSRDLDPANYGNLNRLYS
ncbi:MAG: aryl-sulfate sulfotransferase [SAR202 cluster bacterium]|nr:aryl-sulfate sulfotransferase [SAR202 cluster bacterium]MDP6513424.1 aryl-sulfate sulfotransferase [SAR202 cluster bacterium]